jgi:hypothetical protein
MTPEEYGFQSIYLKDIFFGRLVLKENLDTINSF